MVEDKGNRRKGFAGFEALVSDFGRDTPAAPVDPVREPERPSPASDSGQESARPHNVQSNGSLPPQPEAVMKAALKEAWNDKPLQAKIASKILRIVPSLTPEMAVKACLGSIAKLVSAILSGWERATWEKNVCDMLRNSPPMKFSPSEALVVCRLVENDLRRKFGWRIEVPDPPGVEAPYDDDNAGGINAGTAVGERAMRRAGEGASQNQSPTQQGSTDGPLERPNGWLGTPAGKTYAGSAVAAVAFLVWLGFSDRIKGPGTSGLSLQPAYQAPASERYTQLSPAPPTQPTTPVPKLKELTAPTRQDRSSLTGISQGGSHWSPNGRPWPATASYLKAMPRRAAGGLSELTVDNTSGGSDVYIKLCSFAAKKCDGLRHVFIPQGSSFTMTNIVAGTYDIRYRDLTSGHIAKSEAVALRQIEDDQGTRYSVIRLTLYRVQHGNMSFEPLSEDQF